VDKQLGEFSDLTSAHMASHGITIVPSATPFDEEINAEETSTNSSGNVHTIKYNKGVLPPRHTECQSQGTVHTKSSESQAQEPKLTESQSQTATSSKLSESHGQGTKSLKVSESQYQATKTPKLSESQGKESTSLKVSESQYQGTTSPKVFESSSQSITHPKVDNMKSQENKSPKVYETPSQKSTSPKIDPSQSQVTTTPKISDSKSHVIASPNISRRPAQGAGYPKFSWNIRQETANSNSSESQSLGTIYSKISESQSKISDSQSRISERRYQGAKSSIVSEGLPQKSTSRVNLESPNPNPDNVSSQPSQEERTGAKPDLVIDVNPSKSEGGLTEKCKDYESLGETLTLLTQRMNDVTTEMKQESEIPFIDTGDDDGDFRNVVRTRDEFDPCSESSTEESESHSDTDSELAAVLAHSLNPNLKVAKIQLETLPSGNVTASSLDIKERHHQGSNILQTTKKTVRREYTHI